MGVLSNLLHLVHGRTDGAPAGIRPVVPAEIPLAAQLILGGSGAAVSESQLHDFLTQAPGRGIDLSRMWVAEQAGRVVTAALPVQSPGRTMAVFAPHPIRAREQITSKVIDAACNDAAGRDVHLAQALFDPSDETLRRVYGGAMFTCMAELLYLQGVPRSNASRPTLPEGQQLFTYDAEHHPLFARTILESYRESLDCPALNGIRQIDDVMDGHKAAGHFDPALWYLLMERGMPLGVLLLSRTASQTVELVYLGLTPSARGRRSGEFFVKHALAVTAASDSPRLTLAVDSKNTPALKLYYRNGLSRVDSKLAYMRNLRRS